MKSMHPQTVTPFSTAIFHKNWWQHLAAKFDIVERHENFVVHRKTLPLGLFLSELRLAAWNAAWFQQWDESVYENLERLKLNTHWDYFRMTYRQNKEQEAAISQLDALGYKPVLLDESPAFLINLEQGFEAYLQTISKAKRKDIRRSLKSIELLSPEMIRYQGKTETDSFFTDFFKYHIPYWEAKCGASYFSDLREQHFIRAWAESLEEEGHLLLEGFSLNGKITNLTMNLLINGTLYSLITINTEEYPQYAPGLSSLYYRMKHAADYEIKQIDMGNGDNGYKSKISNIEIPKKTLCFANPRSYAGKLYLQWLVNKKRFEK